MAAHEPIEAQSPAHEVALSRSDGKKHLLLAASGSVATIKIAPIIKALGSQPNLSIRLVLTNSAASFLDGQAAEQPSLAEIARYPNVDGVYKDAAEWSPSWTRGAPILHIELRRWADLMVIAPLSANTMAKLVNGMCDNLLLSVARAWDATGLIDGRRKKILVAPAMNSAMFHHPVTKRQIKVMDEDWGGADGWMEVLHPISRGMACGDSGDGAMVLFDDIVRKIEKEMGLNKSKE
ncbi:flavoprotein [Emericellopsis atlantica]|uniref:Flavoprotein n=1 Tax=Emericellopsis atlantica TaxID=2614577 RepID=A0A9P7ZP16_9HYPO|nr:flavoprotein [Emericellopsis atlantica]KAG9255649.1 flavoprotein [Emericellopsis atlantica]